MAKTELPKPKSTLAEVLYGLITKSEISEQQFAQNGFRSRISDLKKLGIPVKEKIIEGVSRHGNPMKYKVRYLFMISIPKATRIYRKINQHAKVHG